MNLRKIKGTFLDDTYNAKRATADVLLLGVAFEETASYRKGTRMGPDAILNASYELEHNCAASKTLLPDICKIHTIGILEGKGNAENMIAEVSRCFGAQKKGLAPLLLTLGGEHTVTLGALRNLIKKREIAPHQITILQLDAHADLRDTFDKSPNSHACVMRRAHELKCKLVSVGVRDCIATEELGYYKERKIPVWTCQTQPDAYYVSHATEETLQEEKRIKNGIITPKQAQDICKAITTPYLYITIDVDVFDPSILPGTGTPLPNGLTVNTVQDLLHTMLMHLRKSKTKLLGIDLVELAPECTTKEYDPNHCTSTRSEVLAAQLIVNILTWVFKK